MNAPAFDPQAVPLEGIQLIEASAGTGKTWNICQLYLRLVLESGHPVRQLLVMTFTKAATAELRERIRSRLAELLACFDLAPEAAPAHCRHLIDGAAARSGEGRDRLRARVMLALQEFDQAAILTIHGFCQRALADAPLLAGVALEGELLADDHELAVEVVRDFWRLRLGDARLSPELAADLLARGDGPEALAAVLRRHQAKPLASVRWPAPPAALDPPALRAAVQQAWEALLPLWQLGADGIFDQVHERLAVLPATLYKPDSLERARTDWDALVRRNDPLAPLPKDHRLALFSRSRAQPKVTAARAGATPPPSPFFDHAETFLAAHAALSLAVRADRIRLLQELVGHCLPALAARKRALRLRTYDDLLGDLHAALHAPGGEVLARNLGTRFPVALVDEFQDTDPLQWELLRRIYQRPGLCLFMVGDPKQAIYAFRNADLDSYLTARAAAVHAWTLDRNQRAVEALIRALNGLFSTHPQAFLLPGLSYPPVLPGARARPALRGDPAPRAALQVWLLPRDADGLACTHGQARVLATAVCADEILRLLDSAAVGLEVGGRPLRAGDIAVLVRSHAEGQRMKLALAARGVASVERSQASVFATAEAEEVLRVLAAVAEPAQVGRVLAASATVLLGCSAADIEGLRADDVALGRRVLEFSDALALWHQRGFGVMWGRLLEHHRVAERLLGSHDGPRRLTNLRHLCELLQQAARLHPAPLALVHWLRAHIDQPGKDDQHQLRLDSDAQLVQIVTVHGAKGLEFPVVFCPGLWSAGKPAGRDGFGVRSYQDADGHPCIDYRSDEELVPDEAEAIKTALARAGMAEDLRLIYVALTRAAQRCYLVAGAWRSARSPRPECPAAGRTALAWLVHAHPPGWAEWKARVPTAEQLEQDWHALAARIADPSVLAVCSLPVDQQREWVAPRGGALTATAAAPPASIAPRRRIASYTALVAGLIQASDALATSEPLGEQAGRDHDGLALGDAAARDPEPTSAQDILSFPRGAEAGTCLHGLLERIDFAAPASWPPQIEASLREHGGWLGGRRDGLTVDRLKPMLAAWLTDLVHVPLHGALRLADLSRQRCLHELEFHLPAPSLSGEALRAILARHGQAAPQFRFETLHGHLKGFIDLVCEHEGRWYVIDWKSNHLGNRPDDYRPERLQQEVDRHDYALQALIYLLALHRFLRCRLAGYQPSRHLGGALYLFVRGVRPGWRDPSGHPHGVWWLPADVTALDDLAGAFAGQLVGSPA